MATAEELSQHSMALLKTLVGFDSTSRNSNLPIIDFITQYLESHSIPTTPIPSPDGNKSNLLARIGPEVAGGIIFSGHTDVVPIDGQQWDSDPFTLTERAGKLYGRGTSDMKCFLAICLALAPEWAKQSLQKPIWLAFSYDEEIGCLGAPHLLAHIAKHIPKPAFAVIGEPTLMKPVTAHKGVLSFETVVRGFEGHSSQPQLGVNAVQIACELVQFLTLAGKEQAASGMRDERFDPPYSTIHVGTIQGGTARNIIPKECRFQWEIRPLPGDDDAPVENFQKRCKEISRQMKKISKETGITTKPMSHMTGVTLPPNSESIAQAIMHAARANREFAVSFGTEAGVFNDHGVPAIVCGPGSIEQAHKPNEFIDIPQIQECIDFLLRLTADMVTVNP